MAMSKGREPMNRRALANPLRRGRPLLPAGLACLLGIAALCLVMCHPGWGFVHASLEAQPPTRTIKVAMVL